MTASTYSFPIYSSHTDSWFRLSEMPKEERSTFKSWLIDNYLIFEAAVPDHDGITDGFRVRYYDFWKRGGIVRTVDELPAQPKDSAEDTVH